MQIFSKVISWLAFAFLVLVSLEFIKLYQIESVIAPSAVQIIQMWTEYLGIVIPVYCLARLVQIGCVPTQQKDKDRPASASEISERLKKRIRSHARATVGEG